MIRNYLSGTAGDMADTAYNMKKWMKLKREELLKFIMRWIFQSKFWPLGNIPLSLR